MRASRLLGQFFIILAGLGFWSTQASAQSVVHHLHNEASATSGFKQLKTAGPDAAQAVVQTAALQGVATGEKKIIEFNTASGAPNTVGKIPSGATVSAVLWMRKTAALGTMFPRVKVRLNTSTGTALCTATGTTALTTTLTAYTLNCTTSANITMVASDRLYVWTGVNLTAGSSSGAFRGELGVEGTLNGSADSRVDIPTALAAPSITTLSPNAGPVGQTVTLTGNNFRDQQLASTVKFFNNRTAAVTSWSNTSIAVTVPASSATGAVTVTVAGTASAGVTFTVGAVPAITQLAPTAGPIGTPVTITGTNFGATKGSSTVKFNGLTASTSSWSATSITATVPAGATTGNVVVTVGGIPSAGTLFTVPVVTSVTVGPSDLDLPIGSRQRYWATAHYSDGSSAPVSSGIAWNSTDPAVATIGSTGIAQTVSQGAATIEATVAGITGQTSVDVVGPSFSVAGALLAPRLEHSATRLANGTVLVVGGANWTDLLSNAELYDPTTRSFTATGSLLTARFGHSATLLLNGKVLIAGGRTLQFGDFRLPTASAEIYDPATGTFATTGSLQVARSRPSATLLEDGRVLIAGGELDGGDMVEVYDPVTGAFSPGPSFPVMSHTATRLDDGTVLLAAGVGDNLPSTPAAHIYSDVSGNLTPTGSLATASLGHTASRLPDARVLVAGGSASEFSGFHTRAEVFNPSTGSFSAVEPMLNARVWHTANELADGSILVVGGYDGSARIAEAERFDPVLLKWVGAGSSSEGRTGHTATTLSDGTVVVIGGLSDSDMVDYAELFGPPLPAPVSLIVTPANVTLHLGQTQQYSVVDELGRPRYDATLEISDPTLASVGAFGSPTLTALDYGEVTVTATIGAVQGQASVTIEPASLFVTPSAVTMLVDDSRSFTVVDEFGTPRGNAVWSIDNGTVASVVSATGVVTATAAGSAVLTATIGTVTATTQLTIAVGSLTVGAVRWSVAGVAGATFRRVLQSDGGGGRGPAFFAIDSSPTATQIRGLTPDGQQVWQFSLAGPVNEATPNGRGGVLVTMYADCDSANPMRLVSIDGLTGLAAWEFIGDPACSSAAPEIALRHDGSVSVTTTGNFSGFPSFMMLDGESGAPIAVPAIPPSTFTSFNGQQTQGYSRVGPPMVDSSGATHLVYEVRHVAYPPEVTQTEIWLLKVEADGTYATTPIASTSSNVNQFPGRVMPDDHGGVVVTWTYSPAEGPPDPNPLKAAHVSESGTVTLYPIPIQPAQVLTQPNALPINPMLALGENDTVFASYGRDLVSFNLTSGALNWGYIDASVPVTIVSSDADNVVYAKTTTAGTDSVLRFSASGAPTTTDLTGAGLDHAGGSLWFGSDAVNAVVAYAGDPIDSQSVYPTPTMGRANAAKKFFSNYNRIELETTATPDQVFDTFLRTFRGVNNSDQATVRAVVGGVETLPIDLTGVGQTLRFTLNGLVFPMVQWPFNVVTVRFDPASRVIAVETIDPPSTPISGHPLFGWRFWKVFQKAPGQIAVETGALVRPAREYDPIMSAVRWTAFGMDRYFVNAELTLWKQMLEDVNNGLNPQPGSGLTVPQSAPDLIGGKWDWMDKTYILRNLCGDSPPFAIPAICY